MRIGLLVFFFGWGIILLVYGFKYARKKSAYAYLNWEITRNVKKEDYNAYRKLIGFTFLAVGVGFILTGVIAHGFEKPVGWIALVVGLVVGCILFLIAQRKYNRKK